MGEPHGSPKYCTMSLLASNEGLAVGLVAYGSIGFLVQKEEALKVRGYGLRAVGCWLLALG